ncbi:hypothetical protein [Nocardioides jejuensis]|uniref:Uncharacterized protein n=1 Tax=Nocardioides jejuensis TaxID=2502782 RepID=A0A4V2NZX4_9ACTN|nr:hypothetical protein [Nocardioides jejuensis]TCJ30742.1 hypothetical protein EPD65_01520 [Nocardioides jejuensis]
MSPWLLVAVVAVTGLLVFVWSSRVAGGALLLGAVVVAIGASGVSTDLPSSPVGGHPSASTKGDAPWVLRVTLDASAPRSLPDQLTKRWVDVPSVGSAHPDAQGRIVVRGEPGSNVVEMNAVKVALGAMPHVESVERIR